MNKLKLFFWIYFISTSINLCSQDLVPYKTKSGWQLYDRNKKSLQPQKYQAIIPTKGNLLFVLQKGKWGAINRKGKSILSIKYDELKSYKSGVVQAKDDEHFELFTPLGKRISKNDFWDAGEYKNDSSLIVVKNSDKKYGIINLKGKAVLKFKYDYPPEHFLNSFLKVGYEKEGRPIYGLMDVQFKIIIPVQYKEILAQPYEYFLCSLPNNEYDLYTIDGKLKWHGLNEVIAVYEKFLLIRKNEQNGFYFFANKKTLWIPESMQSRVVNNIIVCNSESGKDSYLLDELGNKILFSGYQIESNGRTSYLKLSPSKSEDDDDNKLDLNNNQTLCDKQGKPVLTQKFQQIRTWTDKCCVVGKYIFDGKQYHIKYGVVTIPKGDTLIDLKYDDLILFDNGIALRNERIWTLYDLKGKRTNEYEYTDVSQSNRLSEGISPPLCYVRRIAGKYSNGSPISLCGYINESCQEVIPSLYARIEPLRDRYGKIPSVKRFCAGEPYSESQYNGISALLDEKFQPLTEFKYMYIYHYWDPYIVYTSFDKIDDEVRGLTGLMNINGKEIVKPLYDKIDQIHSNGIIAVRNGRMCFLNMSGKEIVPLHFRSISFLTPDLLKAELYDRETIIDLNGKQFFEPGWFKILEAGFLDGTLFKVNAYSKQNYSQTEEFYIDMNGKEYRDN